MKLPYSVSYECFIVVFFRDTLLNKENISSIVIMSICGLLFVPIVGLTGFHTMLVGRARTTNEQVLNTFIVIFFVTYVSSVLR